MVLYKSFQDAICFAASSFYYLVEKMQMDLHEPPMSQVTFNSDLYFVLTNCFFFRHSLGWTRGNSTNSTGRE